MKLQEGSWRWYGNDGIRIVELLLVEFSQYNGVGMTVAIGIAAALGIDIGVQ